MRVRWQGEAWRSEQLGQRRLLRCVCLLTRIRPSAVMETRVRHLNYVNSAIPALNLPPFPGCRRTPSGENMPWAHGNCWSNNSGSAPLVILHACITVGGGRARPGPMNPRILF